LKTCEKRSRCSLVVNSERRAGDCSKQIPSRRLLLRNFPNRRFGHEFAGRKPHAGVQYATPGALSGYKPFLKEPIHNASFARP
jgi:hypothetical protein